MTVVFVVVVIVGREDWWWPLSKCTLIGESQLTFRWRSVVVVVVLLLVTPWSPPVMIPLLYVLVRRLLRTLSLALVRSCNGLFRVLFFRHSEVIEVVATICEWITLSTKLNARVISSSVE